MMYLRKGAYLNISSVFSVAFVENGRKEILPFGHLQEGLKDENKFRLDQR